VNTDLRTALLNIALENKAIIRCGGRLYRPRDNIAEQKAFAAVEAAFRRKQLPAANLASMVIELAALLDATPTD
jgi:hypothetical protein